MLSYKMEAFGEKLVRVEEATPRPEGTQVLVRVGNCGVCHSDLHIWDGFFDLGGGHKLDLTARGTMPLTLGHEIAGEVVALGPDAGGAGVAVGDRRVIYPWVGCDDCDYCASGDDNMCARPASLGVRLAGGYADHVLVPHPRHLLDYGDMPEELACTYACSGLTAYAALKKAGPLASGDPLLIIGAGGVGLQGVSLAKRVTGVAPIVADIDEAKRKAAIEAGASDAIDPTAPDAAKNLMKATGGFAGVVDFVGAEASAQFGIRALRKGGRLVIVGLFGGAFNYPLPMFPLMAVSVIGSYVGSLNEMRELLELARAEPVKALPIEVRPLDQADATLRDLRAGKITGRAVLQP